jgi:hypothetical protein
VRTLGEIIELTRNGERPDYDELRYAICALDALSTFDSHGLQRASNIEWGESFNRWKQALGKSPKDWIGWNNDPENPEFLARRRLVIKFTKKVMKDMKEETP